MARPANKYKTKNLVIQVPEEMHAYLKEHITPIVKKLVKKWKKTNGY